MRPIMNKKIILAALLSILVFTVYCSENVTPPTVPVQKLTVEILAGPAEGSVVLNNAHFTFSWRVHGGDGSATFTVQLTGVDASPISTTDFSKSYPGQAAGSYKFTVTASGGGAATGVVTTSTAERNFTVGPSLFDPSVTISGARGSKSSGGSGITPNYAPGSAINLAWTSEDMDKFGSVTGYRYKTSDAGVWSTMSFGTTISFEAPAAGSYTFSVEATDNAGATSTATLAYVAKESEILIVDDRNITSFLGELADDRYFLKIFDGFSFSVVDVATSGFSAPGAGIKVVVWYGDDSSEWQNVGRGTTTVLADFIDGGGKLWAMGQGILEDIDKTNPPGADDFEAKYLHTSTTESWDRAGAFEGTEAFSFAIDELSDPVNFPKIKIGSLSGGDVDKFSAGDGAEIVYSGTDGLDVPVGNVALRFPAGNTGTEIFFMTFPLFDTETNSVSPFAAAILVNTIMTAMGQ